MEFSDDVKNALLTLKMSEESLQLAIEAKCVYAELCDMLIDFFRSFDGVCLSDAEHRAYSTLFKMAREWDREDQALL
jgi:hypothetical protein